MVYTVFYRLKCKRTGECMRHLIVLACLLAATPLLGYQATGIVTGRVINEEGTPLASGVVVTLLGFGDLSPHPGGVLALRDAPAGDHIVIARAAGRDTDVAFIQVQPGDSIDILLKLGATYVPFPGSDYPLPAESDLEAATAILPRLIDDPTVAAFIGKETSDAAPSDTLAVWVPWMTQADTLVFGGRPIMRVSRDCAECTPDLSYTIEGGGIYTAAARHLLVSVRTLHTGAKQLQYSLHMVQPGSEQMLQDGPLDAFVLTYARRPDEDWMDVTFR